MNFRSRVVEEWYDPLFLMGETKRMGSVDFGMVDSRNPEVDIHVDATVVQKFDSLAAKALLHGIRRFEAQTP